MLRYQVRGENLEITQPIREYVENKVSKLEKYFADSLERQMRKHKTKINRKGREKGFVNENLLTSELEDVEEPSVNLGKVKQLKVEVMTREEAVFQMELLGHDFFAFLDDKTGEVSIVYKRRDTGYGVLEISK